MSGYGAHISLAKSVFDLSQHCSHSFVQLTNSSQIETEHLLIELAVETLKFLLSSKSLCLARTFIATSEHLVQLKDSCVFLHLNGRGRLILTGPIGKNLFFAGFEKVLYSKDSLDN